MLRTDLHLIYMYLNVYFMYMSTPILQLHVVWDEEWYVPISYIYYGYFTDLHLMHMYLNVYFMYMSTPILQLHVVWDEEWYVPISYIYYGYLVVLLTLMLIIPSIKLLLSHPYTLVTICNV